MNKHFLSGLLLLSLLQGASAEAPLTLQSLVSRAVRNPEVQGAAIRPALDGVQARAARTAFDPTLKIKYYTGQTPVPSTVNPQLLMSQESAASVGISARTSGGITWSVEYYPYQQTGALALGATGTQSLTLQTNLRAALTVPLLRDAGEVNTAPERRALAQQAQSLAGLQRRAMEVITETERTWWAVRLAEQVIASRERSVAEGQRFLELVKARVAAGRLAPYQTFEAQHDLTARTLALAVARRDGQAARERLALLTALRPEELQLAAQEAAFSLPELPSLEGLVAEAMKSRPEARQAEIAMQLAEIEAEVQANHARPKLNLPAEYFTDTVKGGSPGYRVGIEFQQTLGDAAIIEQDRAALLRREAELQMETARRAIEQDLRAALRELESARIRREAAQAARTAAQGLLEAEQLRFETGLVAPAPVLLAAQKLHEASDLEALADYEARAAVAGLRLAQGTALQAWGLEVQSLVQEVAPSRGQ